MIKIDKVTEITRLFYEEHLRPTDIAKQIGVGKKSLNILLRGLLVCKECGKKLGYSTAHYNNGEYMHIYTHCHTYQSLPKLKLCTPHCINYSKLESAIISEVQNICQKYLDIKKCKQIIDANNNNAQNEIELNKEKSNLAKTIEILDF